MQQAKWEESVCRFIEQEDLIHPGDGVLVGVSGGADSVALLRFLWQMRDRLGICLRCIHVEHGIRGQESLRDQYFVEELCRDLGIEERTISVKDRLQDAVLAQTAVEEAAREARYAVLTQEAEAWEKELGHPVRIALAHHAGDNFGIEQGVYPAFYFQIAFFHRQAVDMEIIALDGKHPLRGFQ